MTCQQTFHFQNNFSNKAVLQISSCNTDLSSLVHGTINCYGYTCPYSSSPVQDYYFLLANIQKYGRHPKITNTKHHIPKKIYKFNVGIRQYMLTRTHTDTATLPLESCHYPCSAIAVHQSWLLYFYAWQVVDTTSFSPLSACQTHKHISNVYPRI